MSAHIDHITHYTATNRLVIVRRGPAAPFRRTYHPTPASLARISRIVSADRRRHRLDLYDDDEYGFDAYYR